MNTCSTVVLQFSYSELERKIVALTDIPVRFLSEVFFTETESCISTHQIYINCQFQSVLEK